MGQSRLFGSLQKRIHQLEAEVLPKANSTGTYTLLEQDLIRAFRLLAHAECEVFFENTALAIAARSEKHYNKSKKPSKVLKSLVKAYSLQRLASDPKDKHEIVLKEFRQVVKKNNGIKEKNLCKLLLPLGVEEADLDPTWLKTMDTFGFQRGQVAHGSVSVVTVLDPTNEKKIIAQVLNGIQKLDAKLRLL